MVGDWLFGPMVVGDWLFKRTVVGDSMFDSNVMVTMVVIDCSFGTMVVSN